LVGLLGMVDLLLLGALDPETGIDTHPVSEGEEATERRSS